MAPWSMGTLRDARLLVRGANIAAAILLDRIESEAAALSGSRLLESCALS